MSIHRLEFQPGAVAPSLAARLKREVAGEVLFDRASRGRYATDASIYQVEPVGVVIPKTEDDALRALQIAAQAEVPILARGAASSQCGQTVGAALVIDHSKHLKRILDLDPVQRTITVQPGVVLDQLNAFLRPHGLWFPVDVSTSAQATLGGMAGNNSCGARSIRYGNMVHNVLAIDAVLADGAQYRFGPSDELMHAPAGYRALVEAIHAIVRREADELAARWPKVLRRVQGYNIDMVQPGPADSDMAPHNLAHLLVGSEGTLAYSRRLTLKLAPIPRQRVLAVCHFASFYRAMECTQQIVRLDPDAVELVDRTMIDLARANAAFAKTVAQFIRGAPEAILLVEFAGDERPALEIKLERLAELMGDLGLPESVVPITDAQLQKDVWEVRKAGLNIMMSMKGDGKPVSFIEDCAVPLEHLAEYTDRLTQIFAKHGTRGTWYAHASVGTLHVRPVLDMRAGGAKQMRRIAEEACALVREFKGAYSGEHGDGLVRSEWIEPIIGARLTRALAEIKQLFDPRGLMNPGKIVRPSRMDDRSLFRFKPDYQIPRIDTALDWSEWTVPGASSVGFAAAVEICNNNGHCRKFDAGTMCPSFRATGDEQHLTRGRANTLRLALSGQLGSDAFTSDALYETLDLCVSCKGCKRECPTGVDMARMKIEFLHHYHGRHGWSVQDRLIAHLPRYAPYVARVATLMNLRDRIPLLARWSEWALDLSMQRSLPKWRARPFLRMAAGRYQVRAPADCDVVLLADTFNNYFEPENLVAALRVLEAGGYRVHVARAKRQARPLCCGRTFLASGMVNEARAEMRRMLDALAPYCARGIAVVGLEPSCLFTFRDELSAVIPGDECATLAERALLFEEFLSREAEHGRLRLPLAALPETTALLHGHCHQKAFGTMPAVERALGLVPGLAVERIESSCCGMAGAFGFAAKHYDISMKMGEAALLPRVRAAPGDTLIVADGTSCRHQIADGAGRKALHVARVLERALGRA